MEEEIRSIIKGKNWTETFNQICNAANLQKEATTLVACAEENRILNRYADVHPYDHSRVPLRNSLLSNDYINASLVSNERASRRYILAQGPLSNTVGHFWSMVWQEKSRAILMLNKLIEKGMHKCEQYWPHILGEAILCKDVELRVHNIHSESRNDYIFTKLRITNLTSNEERTVLHFQYTAWPDFGVPRCPDTFLNFLEAVRATGSLEEDVGPPVVHCSAGIGRSGTFCLVDTSLVLLTKEGPSTVILKDILLDLRSYRMGLIQTWEQFKFSYLAIVSGAKRNNLLSENFLDDHDISSIASPSSTATTNTVKPEDEDSPPPLPPPRTDSLKTISTTHSAPTSNNDTITTSANAITSAATPSPVKILSNGATNYQSKLDMDNDNMENHETSSSSSTTKTDESATILNSHKMEERKKEVQELRRQLKEEKKQATMNLLEEIKQKQRDSEKSSIRRKYLIQNGGSFCMGVLMVVAGVAFYYYDRSSA